MPTKPVALVTGANKGIGLAIARGLGGRGFTVWLGCRDPGRGDAAAAELRAGGLDARPVLLDVTDPGSAAAAATRVSAEADALDVLVNNAGIFLGNPMTKVTEEPVSGMREMFEANVLGPVQVTQAFLPLLRKVNRARVIMISSSLGSITETVDVAGQFWNLGAAGYCASKAALNMMTVKFGQALFDEGITVNAVNPGYTATDLSNHMGSRTVDEAAAIAIDLATREFFTATAGFFHDGHASQPARHAW